MADFIPVAKKKDVIPGEGKIVEVKGTQIALFNIDGTIYATSNVCAHLEGPVGEGPLDGSIITCPWHGWRFNVKTGISPDNPNAKIKIYEVKEKDDQVLVEV
jgi:nitrite reductase (NADH) small subunit